MRKVLPFLKSEYFSSLPDKLLYNEVTSFIEKYNKAPTFDALTIEVNNIRGGTDDAIKSINEMIERLKVDVTKTNQDWLIDSTEKFCQERALYNAITKSVEIMDGKSKLQKGAIPDLLTDALSVTFDPNVGHDFFEQYVERYDYYHRVEEKIPFDIDLFNKATKGGVSKKTLNLVMGGVHTGKTRFLCHLSSGYLTMGKNVLYITLEMSAEEIAKRIDANVLNVSLDDLMVLPKDMYENKINRLRSKTQGRLIVKEFPSTSASVVHFRALLAELYLKKSFVPDVIMIDYLNLCASARIKPSGANDLYTYVKSIAEEVRGMAQQSSIPVWSATQLNRTGFGSSDPDLTDTAESFGLPATVDLQWVLITNDQLKSMNQMVIKQLKNRYDDLDRMKRFVVGIDNSKMRIFELEPSAQEDLVDAGTKPLVSKSNEINTKSRFSKLKV